jgi:hypothetical protein
MEVDPELLFTVVIPLSLYEMTSETKGYVEKQDTYIVVFWYVAINIWEEPDVSSSFVL